jgi:hypothetical protein
MVGVIHVGDDGLTVAFHLALTDPATAARYKADNEGRAMQTSSDGDGSDQGPSVKF